VAARHAADLPGRGDQPAPMLLLSQQCGETRRGVEAGQAQPVHRAVAAHQGRRLQVTNQRVILDPHENPLLVRCQPCLAKAAPRTIARPNRPCTTGLHCPSCHATLAWPWVGITAAGATHPPSSATAPRPSRADPALLL